MLRPLLILSIFCIAAITDAQSCRIEPIGKPMQTLVEGERALDAVLNPISITEDAEGNIYFIDQFHIRIRKIGLDGTIQTVAGNGQDGSDGDGGPATHARIRAHSIAVTPDGIVYLSGGSHTIRRIGKDGIIHTIAGTGNPAFNFESGPALSVHLNNPIGLHYGRDGNLYFADEGNNRVRKLTTDGQVITVAGSTRFGGRYSESGFWIQDDEEGDNGPATDAFVPSPSAVFLLPDGQLAIESARQGTRIRLVDQQGRIRTVYGPTNYSRLGMNHHGEIFLSLVKSGTLELHQISMSGEDTISSQWPSDILTQDSNSTPWGEYALLSSGKLIVPRRLNKILPYSINSSRILTTSEMRIAESGSSKKIAGRDLLDVPIQEGPASNTHLPAELAAFRSDGGFYIVDQSVVYLVDKDQQVRRFFGGGTETGNPEGKNPLMVKASVVQIAVSEIDELLVAVAMNGGVSLFKVTSQKVEAVKTSNGTIATLPSPQNATTNLMQVAADSTIYFLDKSQSPQAQRVYVIRQGEALKVFQTNGIRLQNLIRLPDGRVAGSNNSGTFHYHLTSSGMGHRITFLDGVPGPQIAFVDGNVIAVNPQSILRPILKRNISNGEWSLISLNQFLLGPTWRGEFIGTGPDGSIILSENRLNFWKISDPDSCSYIPGPKVKAASLVNSANYAKPDTISPGQLMTIFGENLGPVEGHGQYSDPYGRWMNSPVHPGLVLGIVEYGSLYYAETSLVFGNSNQMNVQVHFDRSTWSSNFEAFIKWHGAWIPYSSHVALTPTNPGLFVLNGGKDGQGAILNQNASVNSTVNPALPGSIVSFYATGLGNYDIDQDSGYATPYDTLPRVKANVTLQIGGQPAEVVYAGGAPGLINGLVQINARVPEGIHGAAEVELQADGVSTSGTQRVTMAVQ